MSAAITQEELFQQILIEKTNGQETTDEFIAICDEEGLFDGDASVERATDLAKRRKVNKLARLGGWVNKDGEPYELVNVIRPHPKTGKPVHHTIGLCFAFFEDQKQLVEDRLAKQKYFGGEAKRLYDDGCRKFGRKFQQLFPFMAGLNPPETGR